MKVSSENAPCSPSFWAYSSLRRWQMFGAAVCLLIASLAPASTPLFQASFQKPSHDWTVIHGTATPDSSVLHDKSTSLRVERDAMSQDACVRFSPVTLVIGKRYELSGWIRTEALQVRDLDRSPIASGATLTMASMPFDVHSASIGGTQPWTHVTLPFRRQPRRRTGSCSRSATAVRLAARRGSKAYVSTRSPPAMSGRFARPSKPSDLPIVTPPPAGSICTSKASPTSADTSTAT